MLSKRRIARPLSHGLLPPKQEVASAVVINICGTARVTLDGPQIALHDLQVTLNDRLVPLNDRQFSLNHRQFSLDDWQFSLDGRRVSLNDLQIPLARSPRQSCNRSTRLALRLLPERRATAA